MLETLLVEYRHLFQYFCFFSLAVYSLIRGDKPEQLIGLVFIAAISFEFFHRSYVHDSPSLKIEIAHAVLDVIMFAAIAPVAMRANRIYPLCILAAQLIAVAMHFQRAMLESLPPLAYWMMIRLPSYLQMVAFGVGLAAHRRRIRKGIVAPPWRTS